MLVRLATLQDRLRSSLFFVPMLFVVGGVLLAEVLLEVDKTVDGIPDRLTPTVDSARGVLSVVAGATLSFAGIAFSVSLLLISLASSQFSPRVVHGLFRDPFNKRVMGVVIGTFTYCLVVLRAVRGPLEEGGSAVVPSVATLVAVVLGVVSVLSIVGFISHAAHMMDVSKILHNVTEETVERTREAWFDDEPDDEPNDDDDPEIPSGDGYPIASDRHGWVQQIDYEAMFDTLPPGSCLRLDTAPGRYAIPNTPVATVWPAPDDAEQFAGRVRAAVIVGESRTMQQDIAYGVRQLADVALKALSPGVNDPSTAQDAMFHLAAAIREMLVRRPPPTRLERDDDRVIVRPQETTHGELIGLAFDEIRMAAVGQPTVQIYLLEILHLLTLSVRDRPEIAEALARQADLVLQSSELADLTDADHERVREAYRHRFA